MDLGSLEDRHLQRLQEGLARDEVGSGDQDTLSSRVNQRNEKLVDAPMLEIGPARQNLPDAAARIVRRRVEMPIGKFLLRLEEPVRHEDRLQFADNRPSNAGHYLPVWPAPSMIGVDDVLRAGVTDASVDYGDLAVIAQVEACGAAKHPNRQDLVNFDACGPQLPLDAGGPRARSDRIDEHPALDAAQRGLSQRSNHLLAGGVRGEDVEEKVDMVVGVSDVLNEEIDRCVVVRQEIDLIAL